LNSPFGQPDTTKQSAARVKNRFESREKPQFVDDEIFLIDSRQNVVSRFL
jgi:hypothetical protein